MTPPPSLPQTRRVLGEKAASEHPKRLTRGLWEGLVPVDPMTSAEVTPSRLLLEINRQCQCQSPNITKSPKCPKRPTA